MGARRACKYGMMGASEPLRRSGLYDTGCISWERISALGGWLPFIGRIPYSDELCHGENVKRE
jgi:hypothetical protein